MQNLLLLGFDFWNIHIPIPLALAAVATIGYLIGRQQKKNVSREMTHHTQRDFKRAQIVAAELEKIAWDIRKSLSKHHASVARFKDRVNQLGGEEKELPWKELCREAEDILKPTMQLATQIATAYDEIRQQSIHLMTFTEVRTDQLTGVKNRRGLDESLQSLFAMLNRYEAPFSLAMFDVDHFKRVNDEFGHLHGDRVLHDLAKLLDQQVRETDIVARFGGEEFVVVMPQTDLEGAGILSDRLRKIVEEKLLLTLSGGVASAAPGDSQDALIGRADAALYQAKSEGRNCVFCNDGRQFTLAEHREEILAG